jgi:uncharacterized protein (TIGR04255 family)
MRVPIKIDPDNLRDAVVDIKFKPSVPAPTVLGYLHKVLSQHYSYNAGRTFNESIKVKGTANEINFAELPYYYNDYCKVLITQNQINFNIISNYAGWADHFKAVKSLLKLIYDTNAIEQVTKVGIRYISEYSNKSVFQYLNGSFTIFDSVKPTNNIQIRSLVEDGIYKKVITIIDNFKKEDTNDVFSLIDVDSQYVGDPIMSYEQLIQIIDETHTKQKETFFSLVNETFLKERNAQYK